MLLLVFQLQHWVRLEMLAAIPTIISSSVHNQHISTYCNGSKQQLTYLIWLQRISSNEHWCNFFSFCIFHFTSQFDYLLVVTEIFIVEWWVFCRFWWLFFSHYKILWISSSWVFLQTASQDVMSFTVNTDRQFHGFYITARCTFLCKWEINETCTSPGMNNRRFPPAFMLRIPSSKPLITCYLVQEEGNH